MAENNEQTIVQAERRTARGKNDSRRLRAAGKIPVTIYGGEGEPIAAAANLSDLAAIIRSKHGISTIFKVAVDGQETEVMFHDRQIDSMKGRLLHADLRRVVRGQLMTLTVPLELVGEAIGAKDEGGVLDHVLHEVEIRCRPSQIPDSIQLDVAELHVNQVLHISDVKADEGIEIVTDPKTVVATIRYAAGDDDTVVSPTPESDNA